MGRQTGRHLHLVQEGAAGGIDRQRVLGQGQNVVSPFLQVPRAHGSGPRPLHTTATPRPGRRLAGPPHTLPTFSL